MANKKKLDKSKQILWKQIIEIEPRMKQLLSRAQKCRDEGGNSFCANNLWYEKFKPELCKLIGFESNHPSLRTIEHYDAGYEIVYQALPDCRNCCCMPHFTDW